MKGKITLEMGSGKRGLDEEGGNKMGTEQWERGGDEKEMGKGEDNVGKRRWEGEARNK